MASEQGLRDGGPAFPVVAEGGIDSGLHPQLHTGMSLRDWFAGQAPAVPNFFPYPREAGQRKYAMEWTDEQEMIRFIAWRWAYADAMIAQRAKAQS